MGHSHILAMFSGRVNASKRQVDKAITEPVPRHTELSSRIIQISNARRSLVQVSQNNIETTLTSS